MLAAYKVWVIKVFLIKIASLFQLCKVVLFARAGRNEGKTRELPAALGGR
jgi:hypothetical protein